MVKAALAQIEEKQYEAVLLKKEIPAKRIKKYGFVFNGKSTDWLRNCKQLTETICT